MEDLKKTVDDLTKNIHSRDEQISLLQRINETLLRGYCLSVGGYMCIRPLEVEVYYVNEKSIPPFVDTNMHCMVDPKSDIFRLQSARYGQLYYHLKGKGGIDVCLSDSASYALCCTIKSARIDGVDVWRASNVCRVVMERICEHECRGDEEAAVGRVNDLHSVPVLALCDDPVTDGCVYHIRRNLRRRDRNYSLPLHSFMDVWNRKMLLTSVERVNLYMKAHPAENVVDVMRREGFRFIPGEIRLKYGIKRSERL